MAAGVILLFLIGVLTGQTRAQSPPLAADLIVRGGKIWTGNPHAPEATAIACWQGRIVALGGERDVLPLQGPATRVIDAQQRRLVPGFHDSHLHLLGGGTSLFNVELKDAADEAEFGRRLVEFDKKLPAGRWLLGGNWDHDRTFQGRMPTAELVDRYVKDRPVFLRRYDGHMALVNSVVLRMAGITATTPDPAGGEIVRRPGSREPSGVLRDNAMSLVTSRGLLPAADEKEMAEAVLAALAELRRVGITSVEDMDGGDPPSRRRLLRIYQDLERAGKLTVRVQLYWPIEAYRELEQLGLTAGFGSERLRIGGVKGFIDGSLGSSTAKMFQPYLHEPNQRGVFVTSPGRMKELVTAVDRAGLTVAVHAIGDEGNATMLDIFAELGPTDGGRRRCLRIEHAQHLRREDIPRFKAHGVFASMQPYHIADDGRWAEGRIGAERCSSSYANRSLLDAGATLAFGSDWPVAPLNPLLGIDAAVHRRTLDGKHPGGWFPDQRITVAEAITAYTRGSAQAARRERELGTLEVGKWADFVVLDGDPFDPAQAERIGKMRVALTVMAGKVVHGDD